MTKKTLEQIEYEFMRNKALFGAFVPIILFVGVVIAAIDEHALLAGLISGLIHNKTIQGSLFSNLHDKLLKIVGINP